MSIFAVQILGSAGALPAYNRHPTAQILQQGARLFMIDCGEGTQMRLLDFQVKKSKIDHIFISHAHGDHYFGLPGLLSTFQLMQRERPLHIFGPAALEDLVMVHIRPYLDQWSYQLHFHPIDPEKSSLLFEDKEIEVFSIPLNHRIPCTGFLFKEKEKPLNILGEKIHEHGLNFDQIRAIKEGEDIELEDGTILANKSLTKPPFRTRSYAFCSDTAYHEPILPIIKEVDLLYHEATFMEESAERAKSTFHSTASSAATIAQKAGAKKLLLGHFSAKYPSLKGLLGEARAIFPESHLAKEGSIFDIPQERIEP